MRRRHLLESVKGFLGLVLLKHSYARVDDHYYQDKYRLEETLLFTEE